MYKEFKAAAQGAVDHVVDAFPVKNEKWGTMLGLDAGGYVIYVTEQEAANFFGFVEKDAPLNAKARGAVDSVDLVSDLRAAVIQVADMLHLDGTPLRTKTANLLLEKFGLLIAAKNDLPVKKSLTANEGLLNLVKHIRNKTGADEVVLRSDVQGEYLLSLSVVDDLNGYMRRKCEFSFTDEDTEILDEILKEAARAFSV